MSKIIVYLKAFIPWFKEYPFSATEEWGEALRKSIPKTQKARRKAVPDEEAFQRKIADPVLASVDKMLRPDFVSKKGLTKEVILAIARAKLKGKNAAKKYNQKVKRGFLKFDQGELNSAMVGYHRGQCFGEYRFKEVMELALGCLTPIIQPNKEGRFKSNLSRQLIRSGKLISNLAFDPQYIKPENDKINKLLNVDCRNDLVPFETGGQSHCDYVLIPESVTPDNSTKVKEIKYKIYKHFLGEAQANKLRAVWKVIDESTPPDPNDYIGHPEKPAHFDMNLDIQISRA